MSRSSYEKMKSSLRLKKYSRRLNREQIEDELIGILGSYYYRQSTSHCIFILKRVEWQTHFFIITSVPIMDDCSLYQEFLLTSRQRAGKRASFHESLLEGAINVKDNDDVQESLIGITRLVGFLWDTSWNRPQSKPPKTTVE